MLQYYARRGWVRFDLTTGGHRRYDPDEVRQDLAARGIPRGGTPSVVQIVNDALGQLARNARLRQRVVRLEHPEYGRYEVVIRLVPGRPTRQQSS